MFYQFFLLVLPPTFLVAHRGRLGGSAKFCLPQEWILLLQGHDLDATTGWVVSILNPLLQYQVTFGSAQLQLSWLNQDNLNRSLGFI